MSWAHEKFVKYVREHAPLAERGSLTRAASKPYDAKYPKLFLTYYSMPDWLDVFSSNAAHDRGLAHPHVEFQNRLGKTPFYRMIAEFKHALKKYHDKVSDALDWIAFFPSGRALLKEIGSTKYSVRVMPYWHFFITMPGLNYDNSMTKPTLPRDQLSEVSLGTYPNTEDSSERNSPLRDDDNKPTGDKGTGKGANVVIFFSAEVWQGRGAPGGPGKQDDEVLFHELAHATRMLRGRQTHLPIQGRGGYGNIEEYFATVITNIYLSDKGETALRGLYGNDEIYQKVSRLYFTKDEEVGIITTDPLPKGWDVMRDPEHFYQNVDKLNVTPRQLMEIFSKTQQTFYRDLATLPDMRPTFNPARLHYRENQRPDA